MEPEELRKLRIAHGLTPRELAEMLDVTRHQILCWEAPKGSSHHVEVGPEYRRRILRQLATFRHRQKESHLIAIAHATPQRFAARSFVPALVEAR